MNTMKQHNYWTTQQHLKKAKVVAKWLNDKYNYDIDLEQMKISLEGTNDQVYYRVQLISHNLNNAWLLEYVNCPIERVNKYLLTNWTSKYAFVNWYSLSIRKLNEFYKLAQGAK